MKMTDLCSMPAELYGVMIEEAEDNDKYNVYKRIITLCGRKLSKSDIDNLFKFTIVTEENLSTITRGYYDGKKLIKHSIIGNNILPAYEFVEEYYSGDINVQEYYYHGKRQSLTDNDGNIRPASKKYIDKNIYEITYYDDDQIQSYADKNGNMMPAKITYNSDNPEIIRRESYYDNGVLQSYTDLNGIAMPAVIEYQNNGSIQSIQFYDNGRLHSFRNKYNVIMQALIDYDTNGFASYTSYYRDGDRLAAINFDGEKIISLEQYGV